MKKRKEGQHVIVRTQSAGVFAGTIKAGTIKDGLHGSTITLTNARRIWYWSGAASLSELAVRGTSSPSECKFPVAVPEVTMLGVIEILPTTPTARESIEGVPIWTA